MRASRYGLYNRHSVQMFVNKVILTVVASAEFSVTVNFGGIHTFVHSSS